MKPDCLNAAVTTQTISIPLCDVRMLENHYLLIVKLKIQWFAAVLSSTQGYDAPAFPYEMVGSKVYTIWTSLLWTSGYLV